MSTWTHPVTKNSYPIETVTEKGRAVANSELLKLLKDGKYNLLKGSNYLYNVETKRIVPKLKFMTKKGTMRPRFTTAGWVLDGKNSNVIYKVKEEHTLKAIFTKHNEENDDKYYKDAAPYTFPKKTEQAKISEDPKKLQMKIMKMKDQGRTKVEGDAEEIMKELENFPKHIHISYVTKEDMYRSGGFLRKVVNTEKERYFILWVPDKKISFPVQAKNVKELWIKTVQRKVAEVKIEPTTKAPTKFPVVVGDVTIYYAKDSWDRRRYMTTDKFKQMQEAHEAQALKKSDD